MTSIPNRQAIDALGHELQLAPAVTSATGQQTYLELMEYAGRELQRIEAQVVATVGTTAEVVARVKSINTIHEKLVRLPNLKLSQMDDLIGVRVVADLSLSEQTQVCRRLQQLFEDSRMKDRRLSPKSGYRAAHVIVKSELLHAEIQVRTLLQSSWADIYEGIADRWGRGIRYDEPVSGDSPAQIKARQSIVSVMQELSLEHIVHVEELRDALNQGVVPVRLDRQQRPLVTKAAVQRRVVDQERRLQELMDAIATMAGEIE